MSMSVPNNAIHRYRVTLVGNRYGYMLATRGSLGCRRLESIGVALALEPEALVDELDDTSRLCGR